MESNYSAYVLTDSVKRIDEILQGAETNYEESSSIPSRSALTFDNGFYVSCSAMFIDMRGSKTLADKHKKPTLAKLYRSYLSELVAVLKGDPNIQEISIEGDCVWGVFNTPYQTDINAVFGTGAEAASLVDILNFKFSTNGVSSISVGIGISYGTALMIKAGYKTSGVNDVAWIGAVVGEAARLCSYGNRTWNDRTMMVSNVFYRNLAIENQKLLTYNQARGCYHGSVINLKMNAWLTQQKALSL